MTTDNTRELDDLLQRFAMSEQQIGDELAVGAIQEETFDVRDTLAREEAKQAILDWHDKQVEAVLDRLESQVRRADDCTEDTFVVKAIRIEAERNKLEAEL